MDPIAPKSETPAAAEKRTGKTPAELGVKVPVTPTLRKGATATQAFGAGRRESHDASAVSYTHLTLPTKRIV